MTINDLPKTIDCPNNCDGVMELDPEYVETFLKGKLDMSFTIYAYECPKCGDRYTTTESDQLTMESVVKHDS